MSFGALRGTLTGGAASITNPFAASGSVKNVVVGDLIVCVIGEQTGLTTTAVSDNLGNTYSAQNAGSTSTISGRCFFARVTVGGTLTAVNATTTASADDVAFVAAVFEGPFPASPSDANPANLTADTTTPYSCPATGTLAQADELIIGWLCGTTTNTWTASAPFTNAIQTAFSANANVVISYQVVAATTTQTPAFTGTAPGADVLGTISFKRDNTVALGTFSGTQQILPPFIPRPAFKRAAMQATGLAAFPLKVPPPPWVPYFHIQNEWPTLPRPKFNRAALRGKTGFSYFTPFVDYGFHIQPWQPPAKIYRKHGSGLKQRISFGFYTNWINFNQSQDWAPPAKRKTGAAIIFKDDTFSTVSGLVTAAYSWFETPPAFTARPKYNRSALAQKVSFGYYRPWKDWFETTPPLTVKPKRSTEALRGESQFAIFDQFIGFGFENQSWQPPHIAKEKRGTFLKGDDGNQAIYQFGQVAIRWFETSPALIYRQKRTLSALKGRSQFAFFQPFINFGFENQSWQPPAPSRQRDHIAAILRGHDGTDGVKAFGLQTADYPWFETPFVYPSRMRARNEWAAIAPKQDEGAFFPFIRFFNFGFENQSWQPPTPWKQLDRLAAIMRGHDGIDGTKPVGLQTGDFAWFETPFVYPSPLRRRNAWAAIAPKDDGNYYPLLAFFNYGFEKQAWQPPTPTRQRDNMAALAGPFNIDQILIQPSLLTADYKWFETPWVYPRKRPELAGAIMRGDDAGINDRFRNFVSYGGFIQPWQPPAVTRQQRGLFLRGDDGTQGKLQPWTDYGFHIQPFQPPAFRAGTKGLFQRGDVTEMLKLQVFFNYGPHGYTPPMLRQVWRQGARSAVILDYSIRPLERLGQVLQPFALSVRYITVDAEDRSIFADAEDRSITPDSEDTDIETDEEDRSITSTDL